MDATIRLCGIDVPRIGFGTLYLTEHPGFGPARSNAVELLREAKRLGVRFFDAADSYGNGSAESAVRAALHPYDGLIVATKGGYRHKSRGSWKPDGRPEHLRSALESSLRQLGVDAIELYQLHCPDRSVPYSDSIGTLFQLQKEGKIRHVGVSNVGLHELEIARAEGEVVSVQNAYSIRQHRDSEVLDACTRSEIAFIPWGPLGNGGISRGDRTLTRIAAKHSATPAQIALAALLAESPVMLPIPGTGSIEHLRENVAASQISLDADDLDALWGGDP